MSKMNYVFQPGFKDKDKVLFFIKEFDGVLGKTFGDGNRNTIKIFKLNENLINIKSFKIPNLINHFAYKYLRKSKARRSFENANYLLSKEIGTPMPIAFIEFFTSFGLKESYYVSEHQDCDLTFRELIKNQEYPNRDFIIEEFTKFTYKLHENNILFKDHSPGNTLIRIVEGKCYFYLVDLNRMTFKTLSLEDRVKNFSRLTPNKEMVEKMSLTYAELTGEKFSAIFELMWKETELFQSKFYRKRRFKKKILFRK